MPSIAEDEYGTFLEWLERSVPGATARTGKREALSASNGPFAMENGVRVGLFNILNVDFKALADADAPFSFLTTFVLPNGCFLNLALVYKGKPALKALAARQTAIKAQAGDTSKVRVYLHEGSLYLRQPGGSVTPTPDSDPTSIDLADPWIGISVPPTMAYYADVKRGGTLDPVEISYLEFIRKHLPPVPISRAGASTAATFVGVGLEPADVDPKEIVKRVKNLGGVFPDTLVHRYHVAMNHQAQKHFVLLTGISGTGKTLLARCYSYAVVGIPDLKLANDNFMLIPVRPDWTEPAHLLGYLDSVTGKYRSTRFLEALIRANANRDMPMFVCLDEMNLAQPEHYFADIMSAMETGGDIHLHDVDEAEAGVPKSIPWPANLYIVGTVNMDETTRPFSPKLLDRANVIDMSEVDIPTYLTAIASDPACAHAGDAAFGAFINDLHAALEPFGLHFGYRTVKEMVKFLGFANAKSLLAAEAMDVQVHQKILTKLKGSRRHSGVLDQLETLFAGLPKSLAKVRQMKQDLDEFESFQYWS
ncbi:hypothetical protein [Geothrix sp.]|jgi:hypothetical protein|uniref:McrB family protein n=1 Tax=Geothrix sp. TaxID=1962974 RepID=UPI0025BD0AF7|nr:hypothetical protein [Geothrix sp.]